MNKKELIEIAKECGAWRMQAVDHRWCNENYFIFTDAELNIFAHRIEAPHKQRIAELELQVRELEENLDIEREEVQSLESEIAGYENEEIKLNEKIEQLREALQGFLDAFNGGYEPSLQTVFIASKAMEQTK